MHEKVIIARDKYPIFQILAALWFLFISLFIDLNFSEPLIPLASIALLLILLYFSFCSTQIALMENEMQVGEKRPFFKQRKNTKSLKRRDYKGLKIAQNEKNHFEIKVDSPDANSFLLISVPNKKPAEKKLSEISKKIAELWPETTK